MIAEDLNTVLPVLVIAVWACVLLIADLFVPKDRKGITAALAAVGLLAAIGVSVMQIGLERVAFGGMIVADGFSSFLQILFLILGLVALGQAYDYLKRQEIERGEYYVLLLFSITGMLLMALAGDLIIVFLALELLSIPLYVLAGFAQPRPASEESSLKYFLLGAFASGFVVYGIALVFGMAGSTQFGKIALVLEASGSPPALLLVGGAMILVGLGFKVAAVPFHMWTPDVYQGAPSSVTSFMSVGAKAAGFAALLRVFVEVFSLAGDAWGPLMIWIAALTMIWGNIAAIAQKNIKRMLAYSSIAHAGYIFMALPAAADPPVSNHAVSAALFYLLAYAITNLGAWSVVITLERLEGGGLDLDDYAGLGKRRPLLAAMMTLFMLSLTGVPPTVGFMAKFYLLEAVVDAGLVGLAVVAVLTSLVSAYYYLRVVIKMYMQDGEPETRREGLLNVTLWLMAICTLLFGLLPAPLLNLAGQANLIALIP
jgi:NADH-quinone oxidoreductase subunit N